MAFGFISWAHASGLHWAPCLPKSFGAECKESVSGAWFWGALSPSDAVDPNEREQLRRLLLEGGDLSSVVAPTKWWSCVAMARTENSKQLEAFQNEVVLLQQLRDRDSVIQVRSCRKFRF